MKKIIISFLLVFSGMNAGCDLFKTSDKITITFVNKVDGVPIALNTAQYTNDAGNKYRVSLLEYIVSNLTIIDEGGKAYLLKDFHYVNTSDAATTTLTLENVPDVHVSYVSFDLGVPKNQNIVGKLPNNNNFNQMQWSPITDGGYHYMRVEGKYMNGVDERSFAVHTGPSGGGDFSVMQKLPVHVHPGESFTITMNLNEWFKTPNRYDFSAFQGNVMQNANAQTILQANGKDAFFADAD